MNDPLCHIFTDQSPENPGTFLAIKMVKSYHATDDNHKFFAREILMKINAHSAPLYTHTKTKSASREWYVEADSQTKS